MSEVKRVSIEGPAGALEAQLSVPATAPSAIAVLCHPHPQYGGSMEDAVLAITEGQLTEHNVAVLRFNFRGVGASEGTYDNGVGEADDVLAAIAWMADRYPQTPCLLAGYSFGAATAWRAAVSDSLNNQVAALWLIAPPVAMMGMTSAGCPVPITIFHPEADDFTTPHTLTDWVGTLPGELPTVAMIPNANHFFQGTADALAATIASALPNTFNNP